MLIDIQNRPEADRDVQRCTETHQDIKRHSEVYLGVQIHPEAYRGVQKRPEASRGIHRCPKASRVDFFEMQRPLGSATLTVKQSYYMMVCQNADFLNSPCA